MLATAGFEESEARSIYNEVNTDGDDGVGLDEFKSWWLASQRQEVREAQGAQPPLSPWSDPLPSSSR